jgi:putative ABC transport system permease protein
MKASIYFNYASRSLLRSGQRTVLAIFCVAVGVMAVVSMQLVGYMLQNSLTTSARDTNGGDIAITSSSQPLKASDLTFFNQLEQSGTITNYSATINANGGLTPTATSLQTFSVEAVTPNNFPLVSQPTFVQSSNGSVASLLGADQGIITQNFSDKYQKHVGDTINVYVKTNTGSGQTLQIKISGIIANSGTFAQSGNMLLISTQDYLASTPANQATYSVVDITTADQAHTDKAAKAISAQFPLASTQTAADVLKSEQANIDLIDKFLEISGLLSLLIGGVGIINTMQVLLSRRKTEIAMLKTTGYHRRDLYLLFGLEAGLLGLIGGMIGSAASIGVSYIVGILMKNIGVQIAFQLSPWIIAGGVAIGFATALIFGLMPIVQAANTRPLNVIRDQETRSAGSITLTTFLLVILSLLFTVLATVILNNDLILGIEATYGAFAFLLILGVFFSLIILAVSKLPIPEGFQFKQLLLVLLGVALSVLTYQVLPTFGIVLLVASLLGIVVMMLPRSSKVSTKMALRNLGRQRTRTSTTMLALFIGIFGIGLVVGLGQDIQATISNSLTQNQPYNIVATASGTEATNLQTNLKTIPGLSTSQTTSLSTVRPITINGQSPLQALPTGNDRGQAVAFLSEIEGYNLSQNVPALTIVQGRDLNASDANTHNVIVSEALSKTGWLKMNLKPGDTLTFASTDGKTQQTVTIVGIIALKSSFTTQGKVIAATSVVNELSPASTGASSVFYMKVATTQINQAENKLGQIAPNANVQDLTSSSASFGQQLNSILDMLVAIASLSVIAAVLIIANAVALAMLERKRELGILKAVGYTSRAVLSQVLLENGIVGTIGAFIAALLATGGVALLGSQAFGITMTIAPLIIVSLIGGSAALAILTAALVAWNAVHIRPIEVLRYE